MASDASSGLDTRINPWLSMWVRPQTTIRHIVRSDPSRHVLILTMRAGISGILFEAWGLSGVSIDAAMRFGAGLLQLPAFVLLIVAGSILGIVGLYLNAAFVGLSGKILGGRASLRDLRAAMAWSQLPQIVALVIMISLIVLYGLKGPIPAGDKYESGLFWILGIGMAAAVMLCLWALLLYVRSIGAVQCFGLFRTLVNLLIGFVLLLLPLFLFRFLAYQPFSIPSGSMAPTLLPGDQLFASKFSYGYGRYSGPVDLGFSGRFLGAEPQRGDLVIFRLPHDPRIDYIKRVIGLPGDRIQMVRGVPQINGQPVQSRRIDDYSGPGQLCNMRREGSINVARYIETLPGGAQYETLDCRAGSDGDDTAVFDVPAGHYFMIGDNRDNSSDSRFSQIAFIPYENLVARASVLYFSGSLDGGTLRTERMFKILR